MALNPYVKQYRYGHCRLLGHMWMVVPSDWTPTHGEAMTVRCERCDIERRDCINRNTGDVESRKYQYPEGYLFSRDDPGDSLPARRDFRVAWFEGEIAKLKNTRRRTS